MVVEPLAPPAAWIWWTHAAWGVSGLAYVRSYAAVEAIKKIPQINRTAAIGAHENQVFDKLLRGLVTSTIFVRC